VLEIKRSVVIHEIEQLGAVIVLESVTPYNHISIYNEPQSQLALL
jgi:hypothetical protein